ncbi:OR6M1 protein, partial [Crocuta crocuta]
MDVQNQSTVTEFTLTAFPVIRKLQISLFVVLLFTYMLTLTGNIVIISLIWADNRLQTPMYFFLSNLSFLDILYTTSVTPKLLACLLEDRTTISFAGCMIQIYFFFFLGTVEFILLAVMSFDRYVAICNPLRYTIIMNSRVCLLLLLGCWVGAFLSVLCPIIVVLHAMDVQNQSTVTEFTLTAFPVIRKLQISLFVVLLFTYMLTLTGNIVIISLIWADNRLQTPMYFFLSNLSFLDILYTTSVTPKLLACLLEDRKTISFVGCITQTYFFFFLGTVEFILLAVMSFDRYVAICNPLRYTIIMNSRVCLLLLLGCWVGAFLSVLCPTIVVSRLPYCYKEISHFFCDIAPLLQVACIDTHFIEMINFLLSSFVLLTSLVLTIVSYTYIISTILRIPSAQGRQKAFSTCASHIT